MLWIMTDEKCNSDILEEAESKRYKHVHKDESDWNKHEAHENSRWGIKKGKVNEWKQCWLAWWVQYWTYMHTHTIHIQIKSIKPWFTDSDVRILAILYIYSAFLPDDGRHINSRTTERIFWNFHLHHLPLMNETLRGKWNIEHTQLNLILILFGLLRR